jgi:hypothetical protein
MTQTMNDNLIKFKNNPKILGLDISTKTVGFALFDMSGSKLLELTHFSPKIKPQPEDKLEELMMKANAFKNLLEGYVDMGIVKVIIEEPLLSSNNVYTIGTLLRYNTMICKIIYDALGIVPIFISTYNARKYAFPDLVGANDKGRNVLFGGYPKDIDKKHVIWEHVNAVCPEVKWLYGRTGQLKKECYDMSDAATAVIGYINKLKEES